MTLYMLRAVFQSIIRSSRLYIQQQAFVKHLLLSALQLVAVNMHCAATKINSVVFRHTLQ